MREYGKIKTCIWGDDKFQQLSVDARLLFIYLQTSPHSNLIGCFRLPIGYVMADLGWAEAKAKASLTEALRYGLIKRCDKTGWTFIVNFIEHNHFESPNVAKTALKVVEQIPTELPFYSLFINALAEHGKWIPEGFAKAKLSLTVSLSEGIGEVLANPEPEPEPEPEPNLNQSQEKGRGVLAAQERRPPSEEITQAVDDWNSLAEQTGLTAIRTLTTKRRTALQARIRNCGLDGWQAMLEKIRGSPFLTGANERGWKADFDWILTESNFIKTTEGKYDAPAKQPNREQTWAGAGDALAAKYRAAADLENGGQGHAIASAEPSLRLATPIRQDAGRA